jgi:hypothetical protein
MDLNPTKKPDLTILNGFLQGPILGLGRFRALNLDNV